MCVTFFFFFFFLQLLLLLRQVYEEDFSTALKMLDKAATITEEKRVLNMVQNSLLRLIESVSDVQQTEWNCIRCFKPLTKEDRLREVLKNKDKIALYHSEVHKYEVVFAHV
jgi:hypothetical protein